MRNLWLFALFACAALAQVEGKAPQPGREPLQRFPPPVLGPSLLKRAAFANPDPQSSCGSYVACGSKCIPPGYTCCPSGGGCPSTHYCTSGGCCERGKVCSGVSGDCPDGTKSCAGASCIPNADPCPTLTGSVITTATTTGSGGVSTSVSQPGDEDYSTSDGTCVTGFKLCGTDWCIENEGDCCNSGAFACDAGSHCTATTCAETCTASEKQCGRGCIASDEDCCGDDGSSCPAGNYCSGGWCYDKESTRTLTKNTFSTTTARSPGSSLPDPDNFSTTTARSSSSSLPDPDSPSGGSAGNPVSDAVSVRAYLTSNMAITTFIIVTLAVGPVFLRVNGRL